MVPQQTWNETFLDGLDDVRIARTIDEQQHREFPIDLGDVALENDLGKDGADERLSLDVVEELLVGNPYPELDDVQVPRVELSGPCRGKIKVGKIGQNARLFEFLAFAPDRSDIHARCFPDT